MERIGIRELRQNASLYLRRVEAGESLEVTDRGRPVARIVPIRGSILDQLIATGRVKPAEGRLEDLPPPLPLTRGEIPPSEVLRRLREDER